MRSEYLSDQRLFLKNILDTKDDNVISSSDEFLNKVFYSLNNNVQPIFKNYVDKDYVFIKEDDFVLLSFLSFNIIRVPYLNGRHLLDKNVLCLKNMFMACKSTINEDYFLLSENFFKHVIYSNIDFYIDKLGLSEKSGDGMSKEYIIDRFENYLQSRSINYWNSYIVKNLFDLPRNIDRIYSSLYNFCLVIDVSEKNMRYYIP
ncbi:MAG: hypothetical protein QXF12_00750 [Candidatus Aenigmatarchaeota archaeon]